MEFFQFKDALVIEVSGRDARRYLNARLTNNIKDLDDNKWCVAAALTPQGKTQGFFTVFKGETESFFVYSDCDTVERTLPIIRQYIVADRVETTVRPFLVFHASTELAGITLNSMVASTQFGFAVGRQRGWQNGCDFLVLEESKDTFLSALKSQATELEVQEVEFRRICAHIPSYPQDLSEQMLFSETRFKEAVSFTKGCYVGQEVIERVAALGKTARVRKILVADGELSGALNDKVYTVQNEEAGTVVFSAYSNTKNKSSFVASIKTNFESQTEFFADNSSLTVLW